MSDAKTRLYYLDAIRGLAAILVVVFHYQRYFSPQRFMDYGYFAVDLFFILSGIVLYQGYGQSISTGLSFIEFTKKRLHRLYPMVLLSAGLTLALNVGEVPLTNFSSDASADLLRNLFFIPTLSRHMASFPADTPMWSLFCELVINLFWFMVIRKGAAWLPAAVLVVSGIGTLALALGHHTLDFGWNGGRSVIEGCVRATFGFFAGVALAKNFSAVKAFLQKSHSLVWVLLATTLILFRVLLAPAGLFSLEITTYIGIVLLLMVLKHAKTPGAAIPLCVFLGDVSYPIYLLHGPIGRLFTHSHPGAVTGLQFLATLIVVAWATHRYAEKPLQRLIKRR